MALPISLINELKSTVGDQWVIIEEKAVERYLYDETAYGVRPQPVRDIVVVKPGSTEEVSEVLKLANKYKAKVYIRGGGTGLVGGAIPTKPGIVLSLERMDKVHVDSENMVAEAEAGATLGKLIEEAEKHNLMFPAHPGDEGAFIGGLIACNAGGSRAVKTGVMRNYVLGLEVVLPTGEVLKLGAKTIKNNFGYNLAHLFVGSEGVLGVVTKAYLRLYPKWSYTATIVVPFDSRVKAFKTAKKLLFSGLIPLALEYFDRRVIEASAKHLGLQWPIMEGDYFLMVILAEALEDVLFLELEYVDKAAREEGSLEPFATQRTDEQKTLLKIRSEIFTALKKDTFDILDTTVPLGSVDKFIEAVMDIERKHGVWLPVYGHVGDGNIHIHVLNYQGYTREQLIGVSEEIYEAALKLGGVITGEHGIGYIRRKYVRRLLGDVWVETMRKLKGILDPNKVLNPDKVIPEE
ncbi:MAG: FAD-binding oxidoreductase [Desulfurococcaceae archaeon]